MALTQAIPITRHPYADGSYKKMLIDGNWVDAASGKRFETHNPATGELLATVAEGDAEDVNRAVAAARRAFEGPWSKVKPFERQALLLKLADLVEKNFEELSQLDTLDMGAPNSRTRGNKLRVLGMLRYYAGQATALHGETIENSLPGEIFSYTLKEPVGVVGAIIPWNGPLAASVWKIGPAIATGCTVILKPAEEAPLTSLRLGELAMEAGIPPGVVNVVPGYGETAGAALASHPDVDKVAFTGSHVTGQSIVKASAGNLKRVSLELGGKSPDIVFADADLDAAVPGAAMAVFANSGQICSAGTRLFVESKVYDEFVGRVAECGKKLQVGNGLDPNTQIGPLVSAQQMERVSGYLALDQKEGAKALAGGAPLTEGALSKGYFVPPTVFANVQDNMRIAQEEIFGPVISAISFKDTDKLIQRANATTFGLGSGVGTKDVSKAHPAATRAWQTAKVFELHTFVILEGALAGYPLTDVRAILYDGKYHDVDSSEMSFKIAGREALKSGDHFLLAMHEFPDGDALGSSLGLFCALGEMGKERGDERGGTRAPLPQRHRRTAAQRAAVAPAIPARAARDAAGPSGDWSPPGVALDRAAGAGAAARVRGRGDGVRRGRCDRRQQPAAEYPRPQCRGNSDLRRRRIHLDREPRRRRDRAAGGGRRRSRWLSRRRLVRRRDGCPADLPRRAPLVREANERDRPEDRRSEVDRPRREGVRGGGRHDPPGRTGCGCPPDSRPSLLLLGRRKHLAGERDR